MIINPQEIAGGVVQIAFRCGDRYLLRGTRLSAEEVRRIPTANRNALIDKKFLHIQLKGVGESAAGGERFVVPLGFGRYDVVEGRKLNEDGPLDREAAHALARKPLKGKKEEH